MADEERSEEIAAERALWGCFGLFVIIACGIVGSLGAIGWWVLT